MKQLLDFDLLAVTIFLLTVFISTQVLKKRVCMHPVFLSWLLAMPVWVLIALFKSERVTFDALLQFVFLTLMLNGGIKASHAAYDFLASKFTFLKERDAHFEKRTGYKL